MPDELLPPREQPARPVERLVVEADRQQRRAQPEQAAGIVREPAPGIDGAIGGARHGRGDVGADVGTRCALDQHVGVVIGKREDPARAVILETPREHAAAVGEQRAGDDVAGVGRHGRAFERESDAARTIDPFARHGRQPMAHARAPCASSTASTTSVPVSRRTWNHSRLGPWYHHSVRSRGGSCARTPSGPRSSRRVRRVPFEHARGLELRHRAGTEQGKVYVTHTGNRRDGKTRVLLAEGRVSADAASSASGPWMV